MKRLILFLAGIILIGCRCYLQDIPIQIIPAGPNCEAPLPNYLQHVTASDNCDDATITQTPLPGTMLNAANPYQVVTIEAQDRSHNITRIDFDVILLDEEPPVITIDSTLLTLTWEQRSNLLKAYHNTLGRDMIIASQGPDSIWTHSMLRDTSYWEPNPWLNADSIFENKSMLMVTSPGFDGASWGTFIEPERYIMALDSLQLEQLGYQTFKIPITVE